MLEDPSNLFVIELASRSSENAGVSQHLQVMCCFFLGSVFESFPEASPGTEADSLSRKSILGMIDAKIELSRFSDLIKIPTRAFSMSSRHQLSDNKSCPFSFTDSPADGHFVEAYEEFYKGQVHAIKTAIYGFYAGSGDPSVENDSTSSESKIIKMQIETIAELEIELKKVQSSPNSTDTAIADVGKTQCDEKVSSLEAALVGKDEEIERLYSSDTFLREQVQSLTIQVTEISNKHASGAEEASECVKDLRSRLDEAESLANTLESENQRHIEKDKNLAVDEKHFHDVLKQKDAEIVLLKEEVLKLEDLRKLMIDEAEAAKRRLRLLEEDLKSPMPFEKMNENKICELEKRNTDLKTQVWEMESTIKSMQTSVTSESNSIHAAVVNLMHLLCSEDEVDMQNLSQGMELCVDTICRLSGHCSDIAESFEVHFDSIEDKPVERVTECIDKLSDILRCDQMKLLEGERFRNQLSSAEAELDRLSDDYDTAFSRLSEVEEENTTLQTENTRLISENRNAQMEVKLRHEKDMESQTEYIVELEAKLADFEKKHAYLLEQKGDLVDSLRQLELSAERDREGFMVAKDLTSIEMNRLIHELDALRKSTADATCQSNAVAEMTVELNHYKGEFARLDEENTANLVLNSKISEEYAQLQVECDEAKKEIERAESDEAMLDELRSDFRHLAEQSDLLQHQKREAEDALVGKDVDLKTIAAEKLELQNAFAAKSDEYNSLLEKIIHC